MRAIGILHPTDLPVIPCDTQITFQLVANTAQAQDWLSTASTAMANAAAAGVGIVRITPVSTTAVPLYATVNLQTTAALLNLATSSLSSGSALASSNISYVIPASGAMFQVSGASTGFSVASQTSGWMHVEMWRK